MIISARYGGNYHARPPINAGASFTDAGRVGARHKCDSPAMRRLRRRISRQRLASYGRLTGRAISIRRRGLYSYDCANRCRRDYCSPDGDGCHFRRRKQHARALALSMQAACRRHFSLERIDSRRIEMTMMTPAQFHRRGAI